MDNRLNFLIKTKDGIIIKLHIQPKASRNKICGLYDDRLKIAITAPPVEGKANNAIKKFLSKLLGISKADIELKSGSASRKKNFLITGHSFEEIHKNFSSILQKP